MKKLLTLKESDFTKGSVVSRLNRFTLLVDFGSKEEKVYLANPGALTTVLSRGREILCQYAAGPDRKTDYDAFAIEVGDFYVTVKSTFANDIFSKILERDMLRTYRSFSSFSSEPSFPDGGRADFLLQGDGRRAYVEVKSCTHVEDGVAKFPDRPTERGKRHLKSLVNLLDEGTESHLVFVVQRKDAKEFRPFKEIDPEFAELLSSVYEEGVYLRAISTNFEPPNLYLMDEDLPVRMS